MFSMKGWPFTIWVVATCLILALVGVIVLDHNSTVRVRHFSPTRSTASEFTFEIPSLFTIRPLGGSGVLPIVRVIDLQDLYCYDFQNGTIKTPQESEVYSYSITSTTQQLHVRKPLKGTWSFRVNRRIKRVLFLPFLRLPFKEIQEVWVSDVFTNQVRPPDVTPGMANSPFE